MSQSLQQVVGFQQVTLFPSSHRLPINSQGHHQVMCYPTCHMLLNTSHGFQQVTWFPTSHRVSIKLQCHKVPHQVTGSPSEHDSQQFTGFSTSHIFSNNLQGPHQVTGFPSGYMYMVLNRSQDSLQVTGFSIKSQDSKQVSGFPTSHSFLTSHRVPSDKIKIHYYDCNITSKDFTFRIEFPINFEINDTQRLLKLILVVPGHVTNKSVNRGLKKLSDVKYVTHSFVNLLL